jgi:hypothetical protein
VAAHEGTMSKKGRRDKRGQTPQKRKSSKVWGVGALIIGIGLFVGLYFFFPKSEPWGLPAIPRSPRPATLSPESFTGRVAEVYRIAQEAPELLEQMPCYCGCYVSDRHQDNLDCYTDRHSVG